MTAYEKVGAARDANKLTSVDYIAHMFGDSFIELTVTADMPTIKQLLQDLQCSLTLLLL